MREVQYPDLLGSKVICFDIETFDPGISSKMGPGVYRNDGYILGVSIGTESGFAEYYNMGHYDCTEEEAKKNWIYVKRWLETEINKLGTNLMYDVDWLENWEGDEEKFGWRGRGPKLKIGGHLYDIQIAEPLIDENQGKYSLDFQANKYLDESKKNEALIDFCKEHDLKGDPRQWIYKMPYEMTRKYGVGDVQQPIAIFRKQWRIMSKEDLLPVFHMETELLRAILLMRKTGVRIDVALRDITALETREEMERRKYHLFSLFGEFNYNSSPQLVKVFEKAGIPTQYNVTYLDSSGRKLKEIIRKEEIQAYKDKQEVGFIDIVSIKPSVTKQYLKGLAPDYEVAKDAFFLRQSDKMISTFMRGALKKFICKGDLLHPSIYAVRNDDFGTRSGRLSMGNPNLQQIPSKGVDPYWGSACRKLFIPNDDCWWAKLDYSQVEYRFTAHFAVGPGSFALKKAYNEDPNIDYHQHIIDLTGLKRRYAKNLNFGVAYGMGKKHMAEFFNWTLEYAEEVTQIYHTRAPYIRATLGKIEREAKTNGFIKTILGRRSRLTDPKKAYTMFCRKIQGSAADLIKKAMVDVYEAGLMEKLPFHLTVHDELDLSVSKTAEAVRDLFKVRNCMQDAISLSVPVRADIEIGTNWSTVVELDFDKTEMSEEEWLDTLTDENVVERVESLLGKSLNK